MFRNAFKHVLTPPFVCSRLKSCVLCALWTCSALYSAVVLCAHMVSLCFIPEMQPSLHPHWIVNPVSNLVTIFM